MLGLTREPDVVGRRVWEILMNRKISNGAVIGL